MCSLWLNILITITVLITNISNTQSASCNSHTIQSTCEVITNCKWITTPTGSTVQCVCASESKLDILIGIDGSGSVGNDSFQIQKQFIAKLVTQSISNTQRIGFTMFATTVDILSNIQVWNNYQTLQDFVMNINWPRGWTNTAELLASAQTQFASISTSDRKKILLIITDGNPCMPANFGGCPHSVCQYESQIKNADIRVIIVGVGDGWNPAYLECLTQISNDVHAVTGFTSGDFDAIVGDLSAALCPSLPTNSPTTFPNIITDIPSSTPSKFPSIVDATIHPSISPTKFPVHIPSSTPTKFPSSTVTPSKYPTVIPSKDPTVIPSKDPTLSPISAAPTYTTNPTTGPTQSPITNVPTRSPICEIFECEPVGGANKVLKTSYGFGFILTLISCFVMYSY